jgi:hypothetical protein
MVNKQFEFNLIISKFTENIEIMIKLLNFINDYINNNDINENIDKLLIFYFQVIIFLFKNILQVSKYDKLKLAKYSAYLSYKYSTMILKKISNIEYNNLIIKDNLQSVFEIKKNLLTKLNEISSLMNSSFERHMSLNKNITKNSTEQILNRSAKYKLSSENIQETKQSLYSDNITSDSNSKVNIMNIFTDTADKSENKYNINNIMNFFSDEGTNINKSINTDNISDDNNYQEVDMTSEQNILITEDKLDIQEIKEELNKISNNSNIPFDLSNKDTVSENLYANNFESNKIKSSNIKSKSDFSYNTNSALLNSKLYELNL